MASCVCAAALSPSSAAVTLSLPNRGPTLALLQRKARPFSLSVDRSSTSLAPLLSAPPLVSPSTLFSRKWNLSAAPEGSPEEPEEPSMPEEPDEPSMPEPVEAQIAAAATPKGEDVFAVVMIGSRQYIVFPGRFIYTQRLKGANVDDKIILNKVLLVGTRTKTYIGQPVVTNAAVHAVVEEQGLDKKVIVFKFKRKKNYRRTIGHRQPRTRIRITGITGYEEFPFETLPEMVPA